VENENRLRSNGVDFFRGGSASQGMSTEDPYGLLVVDHGKLIPTQGDPDPLDNEPIEASDQHNQLGNTWFGIRWNLEPVQEVATEDTPEEVHDKLMSNTRVQYLLSGGKKEAQEIFTLSGDPRYKHTFLDYDRPFDPYPIHFWDANPDLQILDEEAEEENRIAMLGG
jgi:hypothetical protein